MKYFNYPLISRYLHFKCISMNFSIPKLLLFALVSFISVYTTSCRLKKRDKSQDAAADSVAAEEEWMKALMDALQDSDTAAVNESAQNRLDRTYNPSATRINDLLHTRIEISFDIP